MHLVRSPHALILFSATVLALAAVSSDVQRLGAATAPPVVDQSIVATVRGGDVILTGTNLGELSSSRAILFDYGTRSATIISNSPLVNVWQTNRIEVSLPWDVVSGELRVVVDGKPSEPIELLVYEYDVYSIPTSTGTNDRPLAVIVTADGTAWLNQEFHRELKAVSAQGAYAAMEIPQAPGPGIFATTTYGLSQTRTSVTGEDITADSEGNIWFTQGGAYLYDGPLPNTSRVVRFDPGTNEFACFNVPSDNATSMGVLVDNARRMIWYSEAGLQDGNAISALSFDSTLSNCYFDPNSDDARDAVCSDGPGLACHWRFPLPRPSSSPAQLALDDEGNIWFTEFWGTRIGMLRPETGEIVEFPLPPTIAQVGPGRVVGSGPWELAFANNGDLWINEFFDATVLRLDVSLVGITDCEHLTVGNQNPCIEEVVVASNGSDYKTIHSLSIGADGLVWFAVTETLADSPSAAGSTLGFIAPSHGNEVVFLPQFNSALWLTGTAHDPITDDVWVAGFEKHELSRLRLVQSFDDQTDDCPIAGVCSDLDTDGDGCTDAEELGSDELLGGRRDPENLWDFFDTPDRNNVRDHRIDLPNDILGVILRMGSNDDGGKAQPNRNSDPFSPVPADISAYHPVFDRSPGFTAYEPWNIGPPDGRIGLLDLLSVVLQYGHRCSGI